LRCIAWTRRRGRVKGTMTRILIGCLSGWQMWRRRQRCMETWWRDVEMHAQGTGALDAVFALGVPEVLRPERQGNCLFLPCPNDYPFLPSRIRWLCRWALDEPLAWDYLFKTDDDVRLDVHRLAAYELANADYCGHAMELYDGWGHDTAGRKIKAKMKLYASGCGYFLSRRAAAIVAERFAAERIEQGAEDLLVGQVLREAGIQLTVDNARFHVLAKAGEEPGPANAWIFSSPAEREPE